MEFPPAVGVRESAVSPRTGVYGRGDGIGVEGLGDSVGVRGGTTGSPDTSGIGVLGHSGANRAGVFYGNTDDPDKDFLDTLNHSEKHPGKPAQLRLVPYPGRVDLGGEGSLTKNFPCPGLRGISLW